MYEAQWSISYRNKELDLNDIIFLIYLRNIRDEDIKMNCSNCGTTLNNINNKFCEFCGIELPLEGDTRSIKPKEVSTTHSRKKHCC